MSRQSARALRDSPQVQVIGVLVLYKVLWFLLYRGARMGEERYFSPSVALEGLADKGALAFLALFLPVALLHGRNAWSRFDEGRVLRITIGIIAVMLAWQFATYEPNSFYGRAHVVDRGLVVALAGLALVHPVGLAPFLLLVFLLLSQLYYPFGNNDYSDKRAVFDVLIVFLSCLCVRLVAPIPTFRIFTFMGALFAANYWYPGILKLLLSPGGWEWALHNELTNLVVASRAHGWLAILDEEAMVDLARLLEPFNVVMLIGTLVIEVGSILTFWNRRAFYLWAFLHVQFHVAVLVMSGVFFWKWIVVSVAFVYFVHHVSEDTRRQLFSRRNFAFSVALIVGSPWLFEPAPLAWHDTRMVNSHVIEFVGESGRVYRANPKIFNPYDVAVTQNRFYFLRDEKTLLNTYGGTPSYELAQRIKEVTSREEIEALRDRYGVNRGSARRTDALERFFTAFGRRINREVMEGRSSWRTALSWVAPPHHLHTLLPEAYDRQEPVTAVRVRYFEKLLTDDGIVTFRDEPILVVPIPRE